MKEEHEELSQGSNIGTRRERKGGRSLGGTHAGSPGSVPLPSFYLIGPPPRVDVVAALIEIKGVDGQQPFGLFHLLGGAETPSPTERREKEEEERSQERKFPQIAECFRHTNRLSEHRLIKEEFIRSSPRSWRSKASGCC